MKHDPSFFECTAGERRGLIVLSVLILVLISLRLWMNNLPPKPLPPLDEAEYQLFLDFEARQQFLEDSMDAVWDVRRQAYRTKDFDRSSYRKSSYRNRTYTRGKDVSGFTHRPFTDSLRPVVNYPKKRTLSLEKVELNAADTLLLRTVPGIGLGVSREIVRYRERLGGFVRMEQLLEVKFIDSARYLQVIPYLSVDTLQLRRIDINRADVAELKRHPYIDHYLAKTIVLQRERLGRYASLEQMRVSTRLYPELYARLRPYLKVQ